MCHNYGRIRHLRIGDSIGSIVLVTPLRGLGQEDVGSPTLSIKILGLCCCFCPTFAHLLGRGRLVRVGVLREGESTITVAASQGDTGRGDAIGFLPGECTTTVAALQDGGGGVGGEKTI